MKIAQVNDISNVPSALVEGLRSLGHDATLFPLNLVGGKLPTWSKALLLPWRGQEMRSLNRQIRGGRFDVVHIHFAYLGWAGILGKYPYFLHCHGTDVRRNLRAWYQRPFIVRSLERARRVFFSTPDLAEYVLPVRPDAVWVPNPISAVFFGPDDAPDGDQGRRPCVLFISSLSRIKGVERAFQVIELLNERVPDVEICVMGFGDQLRRYEKRPEITVLPRVAHEDMPALIRRCDVAVGQLRLGIVSMSEAEAMACGKPVVGEFHYPEAYSEPPPILTGETPEALADHIVHLLDDADERRDVGRRSREWVMKHHDCRLVARMLESYYLEA
jgi:glycosyltransferase involved in cell wall biosynthesis